MPTATEPYTPGKFDMWKDPDIPRAVKVWQTCPIGNLPYLALAYKTHLSHKTKRADNPPETHIMVQQTSDANHLCSLYKHLALLFSDSSQLCIYMTSPHILAPNVWKCYQDFPINTNSLISFHEQYSVLLHQGTTFKELLSLVFYRKRAELQNVTLTFTFMYQVSWHLRMQIYIL